jgi:hypothetical protein
MNEIKIYEENRININEDKFIQRMIVKKKIEKTLCDWIIKELKKYEKDNNEWKKNNFIDDIDDKNTIFFIEKINKIFYYILEMFGSIIDDITKCYNLNNEYLYKINEIFIEKYEDNLNKKNYINYINCDIVINILLNKKNEFICFSDNIISNIEIGDMIIFSSNTNHYKIKTNNNTLYVLVGLINIYKE